MTKPYFVLLVGPPGCGKSTIARQLRDDLGYSIVSSDAIRKNLYGSEEDQTDPSRVFGIAHTDARNMLHFGYSVVFDATNCRRWHREAVLDAIKDEDCHRICAMTGLKGLDCLERNEERDRQVPGEVVMRMAFDLESDPPSVDEGYDMVCALEDVPDILRFLERRDDVS